LDAQINLTPA